MYMYDFLSLTFYFLKLDWSKTWIRNISVPDERPQSTKQLSARNKRKSNRWHAAKPTQSIQRQYVIQFNIPDQSLIYVERSNYTENQDWHQTAPLLNYEMNSVNFNLGFSVLKITTHDYFSNPFLVQ